MDFELINIDRENKKYQHIDITDKSDDLKNYIKDVIESITDGKESRVFKTTSETTEVFTAIKNILLNSKGIGKNSETVAKRLLRIEDETQNRYQQITDIKKGSLFVCKFDKESITSILLVKIEHTPFIDENDLKKHIGLPFKNEILKSCLFQFDDENNIISIMAHDSNGDISDYWWNKFLELEKVSSDIQNTILAFGSIENVLNRNIKNKSPADYSILRNNLIGYFRTQPSFVMNEMVEHVVGNYQPLNSGINISEIKAKILETPNKKSFDTSFTIVSKEINAKMRHIVKINNDVELRINNYITDLQSVVYSEIGQDGKKYIKIVADDNAFSQFNFQKE